jgi:ABC-2 type transport system permease protein
VLQVALVILVGHWVFGVAWPTEWASLLVFLSVGVVCFASLGVALSHAIPNPESAPAWVNAVFLPQILIAGVFYDEQDAPQFIRDIAEVLPLKHLIDGLSGAMVKGEGVSDHLTALLVLGIWTVVGVAIAVRGFSWEARRED